MTLLADPSILHANSAAEAPPADQVLLGRQPIVDRNGRLHAFELLFRSGRVNAASHCDDVAATSQVLHHVFAELGVERALGPYRGFVNCDTRMLLMPEMLDVLPRGRVVIEVLESVTPDSAIMLRLRELKRAGFVLALDDYGGQPTSAAFLELMDYIKIDLENLPAASLAATVAKLRRVPARLVAEKVQTRQQADACHAVGIEFFQGYYFARPVLVEGRKLSLPQVALLRLVHLLAQDAETGAVVDEFKRHPGLSLNVLRIANSAAVQAAAPVTSIAQAVVIVGRKNLRRWVQLLLYADASGSGPANPLLQLAATRGRLMESLAATAWPEEPERAELAFMVGILSLMPVVFGVAFSEILPALPLPADVERALLAHDGRLGALLLAVERQEDVMALPPAEPRGIAVETYSRHLAAAMAWAHQIR